ncbi:MAG TPA: hypothetical protein PLP57_09035 [Candidatus Saccharicenans sp.]|nr:hypothetical protein [Candidatus Saccharicenans sp.]HRD02768.1 hypothetical protein [Candidatus Saccharicenans sp.]
MIKNFSKFSWLLILGLCLLVGQISGQTAQDLIRGGDEFYDQWEDQKALDEYLKALQLEPQNYEALWKISRSYMDLADVVTGRGKEVNARKFDLYARGETYARRAITINPDDTWGHFFLSALLGNKILLQGKKEQIDASKIVKTEIDRAIELDPSNDLAYHDLGRWHRRMAEIGGAKRAFGSLIYGSIPKGSFEESEKWLKKALELKPDYINHHLELGWTYADMKKEALAIKEFSQCLILPETCSKDKTLKDEARAELEKLNKKG